MDAAIRSTVVPDLWEEQARGLIPAYILFEREYWTGEKVGFCSRCGHSFRGGPKRTESFDDPDVRFRRAVHNDRLTCPECGADAVVKARGKFRNMKTLRGNVRAVFCQKITPKLAEDRAKSNQNTLREMAGLREEKDALQTRIDELEKTPVVEVREMTDDERKEMEERIREQIGTETDALRAENKKLRMAADPVTQKFRRYFDDWREAYAGMKTVIAEAEAENEAETADNLKTAVRRLVAAMREEWS